MKKLLILLLLFHPTLILSQSLREFDLQEMGEQQIPVFIDHPNEAVLIFYTAINGFTVQSSTGGIVKIESEASKVTVFVKPERQILTIKAPGFFEQKLAMESLSAKEAKFYKLNQIEVAYSPEKGSFLINTTPNKCLIRIEGIPTFKEFSPFELKDFEAKKYRINLTKPDYDPLDTLIEIRNGMKQEGIFKLRSVYGSMSVKASAPVKVKINNQDVEVGVEINTIRLKVGTYSLSVNDYRFDPITEKVNIESGETKIVSLALNKRLGNYLINTVPEGCLLKVYENPKSGMVTPFELKDLEAKKYRINVSKTDYYPLDTLIEIRRGMNLSGLFVLRSMFGVLNIKAPVPVQVKLNNETIEVGPVLKSLKLRDGSYTISVNDSRFDPFVETISVESGETQNLDLPLIKRVGYLQIQSEDSFEFIVNGEIFFKNKETQVFEFFEGTFKTQVKRAGFQNLDFSFKIEKGKIITWEPAFQPVTVTINLNSRPEGASLVLLRDGKQEVLGFTPFRDIVQVGEVEFVFKLDGNPDYSLPVRLEEGKPFERIVDLQNIENNKGTKISDKKETDKPNPNQSKIFYGELIDVEGNRYRTVVIGNQEWTVENFRTTKYNDGTPIEKIVGNSSWTLSSSGAYSAFNYSPEYTEVYGLIYNWFCIDSGKLAPSFDGWRVPNLADWNKLESAFSGNTTSLKSKTGWISSGNGQDAVGFCAFPVGSRDENTGKFSEFGKDAGWWSSTTDENGNVWVRYMFYNGTALGKFKANRNSGFSIRLVRDR